MWSHKTVCGQVVQCISLLIFAKFKNIDFYSMGHHLNKL